MPAAVGSSGAVAGLLAFEAVFGVGHGVESLADGLFALAADAERIGGAFDAGQGPVHTQQNVGARTVALRGNDLPHLHQGLGILIATRVRVILAHGLDGHVAFGENHGAFDVMSEMVFC